MNFNLIRIYNLNFHSLNLLCLSGLFVFGTFCVSSQAADEFPPLSEIKVTSSLDESLQPSLIWVPERASKEPTVLFVYLHSWSGDYHQKNDAWFREAIARNWIYLHPNFRGPNSRPEACGSRLARQDIIDAIEFTIKKYQIDESRIYLAGASGGGHMSMLMAGYYPNRFSAVSAWVGISDLAKWYEFHTKEGKRGRYAQMTFDSCGGAPGDGKRVASEYISRSPIHHLHNVGELPIELCAGITDGYTGSVPIAHTLNAFNVIAKTNGHKVVSSNEMSRLEKIGSTNKPDTAGLQVDPTYERAIFLRQQAGAARVTIFNGGHEGIAKAGVAWLEKHRRNTKSK